MSQDMLPDLEDEPLSVTTLFPDPEYWAGWSEVQEQKRQEIKSLFEQNPNPDIVGITHTDADGYGCEVMLREAFPDKDIQVVTASESGPLRVRFVGDVVAEKISNDTPVYITDIAPDEDEGSKFIDPFRNFHNVTVIDHHEWNESDVNQVEWESTLIRDTERCATQIVHDELIDSPRQEISRLADLTADHDLWIKEQREKSDKLSDLSQSAEREKYVELCVENGDKAIRTKEGSKLIKEQESKREKKTELAVSRASFYEVENQDIAITYGNCDGSHVGEVLYDEHNADVACIIYPSGSVSIRTPNDNPIARDVASKMGGGGHECAAGAKPDVVGNSTTYTTHWVTRGRAVRQKVLNAVEVVLYKQKYGEED
jgi:oligoribonuclease NrnB/cAMP/cGMP phosphodiesterase (DHH superfamily)